MSEPEEVVESVVQYCLAGYCTQETLDDFTQALPPNDPFLYGLDVAGFTDVKLDNSVSFGGVPFSVWFTQASADNEYGRPQLHSTTLSFRYEQPNVSEEICDEHFQAVLDVISDHESYANIQKQDKSGAEGFFVPIETEDTSDSIREKIEQYRVAPTRYKIRRAALSLDKATSLTVLSRQDRTQKESCRLTIEFRKALQKYANEV